MYNEKPWLKEKILNDAPRVVAAENLRLPIVEHSPTGQTYDVYVACRMSDRPTIEWKELEES